MSPNTQSPRLNANSVAVSGFLGAAAPGSMSNNAGIGGVGGGVPPNLLQSPSPNTLNALVSQHRLMELSRFNVRGYDLAHHMLTQQGAVSKLLGECKSKSFVFIFNILV